MTRTTSASRPRSALDFWHFDDSPAARRRTNVIAALILIVVTLAARAIAFGNPAIGFDEQFYLLVGDRMLDGALPYVDIFDRKPIGIFLIYAGSRLLGGDGFVAYKLVAAVFVVATAFLLYRTARHRTGPVGALFAAICYILWLNVMEGEGGQTPVFYNLFVLVAGAQLLAAARDRKALVRRGCIAMLAMGIAIQIKYTVVFEGALFGCAFLLLFQRRTRSWLGTAAFAAAMVALALLPTGAAMLYYSAIGHLDDFLFSNFLSVFGQGKGSFWWQAGKLVGLCGIFLPMALVGVLGRNAPAHDRDTGAPAYLVAWFLASLVGVLIYWRFNSPHYAMPLLAPALLLLAPALDLKRRVAVALAIFVFIAGQIVLVLTEATKGGAAEARAVAAAAQPRHGRCIFVYDGYPGLYMLTHSCLPSRWAFPGHINAQDEANPAALGADPVDITRAILDRRPEAIIDTYPAFEFGNHRTHALMEQVLRERYVLTRCVVTRSGKLRLIYRERGDGTPRALDDCPIAVMRTAP